METERVWRSRMESESLETNDRDRETLETKDGDPESLETKERIRREWRLAGQSKSAMWGKRDSTGLWTLP